MVLIWHEDCRSCLLGFSHSQEQHNQALAEKAAEWAVSVPFFWSDDCRWCLVNALHTSKQHDQELAKAQAEMQEDLARLRDLLDD